MSAGTRSSSSKRKRPRGSAPSSSATSRSAIGLLLADLRERGIVTKVRHLSDGRTVGGIPFTRGSLAYLLRNRFYVGEIDFKREICSGEHPPLLDRGLFEA